MKGKVKQLWGKPENRIRFLFITGWLVFFLVYILFYRRHVEGLIGIAAYFGFWLTLESYFLTKRIEKSRFGNEKRHEFITNKKFADIQGRIEHNNPELLTVLAYLNVSPNPYEVLLPLNMQKLHEDFDNYLNWMEGFAVMWQQNLIHDDELKGLWSYYMKRLRTVEIKDERLRHFLKDVWAYDDGKIEEIYRAREGKVRECPIEHKPVDPITNPVWSYIIYPPYEFEKTLIKLAEYCYDLVENDQEG